MIKLVSGTRDAPRARVLLADDNRAILKHVTGILEGEFLVVGAVTSAEAALEEHELQRPDLIVLDISMGAQSGIDAAKQIRDAHAKTKIVFLTVHEDRDFVSAAFGAGASAYVLKSRLRTDLIPAIKTTLSGGYFVSPPLALDSGNVREG